MTHPTPKRGRGKPPRAGEAATHKLCGVRVTEAELQSYTAAAKRRRISRAEWIRRALSESAELDAPRRAGNG